MRTLHQLSHCIAATLIIVVSDSAAQTENNWWYFHNVAVDFNTVTPVVHTNSAMAQVEGSSSISNADGELLFYTDGVTVWNKNNLPMPNGQGLLGSSSSTQSALIVPQPSSCHIYYIFTVPAQEDEIPLAYSVVNMSLDGGLGDITLKNVPLIDGVTERLSATQHTNGVDRWIVGQRCTDLAILSFRLTASGVDPTPVISQAPPPLSSGGACHLGYLKIAPNGRSLCTAFTYAEYAYLMNYDPSTGLANGPIRWTPFHLEPFPDTGGYGVEFSPNSSRLYLQTSNAPRVLVQYDLWAGDSDAILASRYVVDSAGLDPNDTTSYLLGGALQSAPNGTIYVNRLNKTYLSAITDPDALNAACGYVEHALDLSPLSCQNGLPNQLPSYSLCTAHVGLDEMAHDLPQFLTDPSNDRLIVSFRDDNWIGVRLVLLDMSGRMVLDERILSSSHSVELQGIAPGCYVASLMNSTITVAQRIVLEH